MVQMILVALAAVDSLRNKNTYIFSYLGISNSVFILDVFGSQFLLPSTEDFNLRHALIRGAHSFIHFMLDLKNNIDDYKT